MNCAFCENPEIKNRKITENSLAWAFLGNMPIVPGHTLIVPKRCVNKYENLTKEEKDAIENLRIKVMGALKKTFDAQGFNFAWNDEKIPGQSLPHFHLHVLPRKEGDTGIYKYEPRDFLYRSGDRGTTPEEELKKVSELIVNNI